MKIGNYTVDFKGLQIDGPDGSHLVEPKIMGLLQVLVDNDGDVMTREELITAAWGVQYGGDESLSRAISILRKVLGEKRGAYRHIITIPRVGYRFITQIDQNVPPLEVQSENLNSQVKLSSTEKDNSNGRAMPLDKNSNGSKPTSKLKDKKLTAASIILACLFLVAIAVSSLRTSETLSRQAKMERGFSHIENFTPKGAISEAQDIFNDILSKDPDHAAARAGLAFAIFREYMHLERDPALLQRGKAYSESALREDEHLATANIAVAWAALLEGNLERSNKYLDIADILDPDNMFALEARFGVFIKEGQTEKAEDIINTGISRYPNHALFYGYRGEHLAGRGDFTGSEDSFRKAINLSPDSPRLYAQLAQSLHLQNKTNEAVDIIQQGLNVNETALLYSNLGTYLFFQGQYDLASSAFEKTLELSGDTHDYLYWANLGDAQRWSKDKTLDAVVSYKRALQLLSVELERVPNDVNLKSRAAMFNAKLGSLDEAQRYMDSFELTSESPAVQLYRLVVTNEIMSNRAKALEYLEAAISSNYPMIEILNDPELTLLRQDPAYHKLLAKTSNN